MSNKIFIRFKSENSHSYDKLYFSSDSVTYAEIIEFLSRKKKIESSKKSSSFQKNKLFLEDSSADTQKSSKKNKPPIKHE